MELAEGITYLGHEQSELERQCINFLDHGPSHTEQLDLAAREFDAGLLSNLNFRNPDSFRLNILTAGLEEVRAVLQYQVY